MINSADTRGIKIMELEKTAKYLKRIRNYERNNKD